MLDRNPQVPRDGQSLATKVPPLGVTMLDKNPQVPWDGQSLATKVPPLGVTMLDKTQRLSTALLTLLVMV